MLKEIINFSIVILIELSLQKNEWSLITENI